MKYLILAVLFLLIGAATGELGAECQMPDPIYINEVLYKTKNSSFDKFIELKGQAGTKLDCMKIVALNGGQSGTSCNKYLTIDLSGHVIDETGYFVIGANESNDAMKGMDMYDSKVNSLQLGPDGIALIYYEGNDELVYDALIYGSDLPTCPDDYKIGSAATGTDYDQSLGLCSEEHVDDNSKDFAINLSPTPKKDNVCPEPPEPCDSQANVVINEILYSTNESSDKGSFVELRGDAGTDLRCYELTFINGSNCSSYNSVKLKGIIPATGLFVIGMDDSLTSANMVASKSDFQNGPDGLTLVYHHDSIGDILLDALGYGDDFKTCESDFEGTPATDVDKGISIARKNYGFDDKNDNSLDFTPCSTPSPGELNNCPEWKQNCVDDDPQKVKINEFLYSADPSISGNSDEFIELYGTPGLDLSCYKLVPVNGADCKEGSALQLNGTIGDDGFFVIGSSENVPNSDMVAGKADLQNGPDALKLVYTNANEGDILVDSVVYGGDMSNCGFTPNYAPKVDKSFSLARQPDGDGDYNSFESFKECKFPSPGEPNTCSPKNCNSPDTSIRFNEILYTSSKPNEENTFIEIKGPAGLDLNCYSIKAINGSNCAVYEWYMLKGAIKTNGYFVIATTGKVENADMITKNANLQNGPDAVQLVYNHSNADIGEMVIDTVAYKNDMSDCIPDKKDWAPGTDKDYSLAIFPETDEKLPDDKRFMSCSTPTPGMPNQCIACLEDKPTPLWINEVLYATSKASEISEFVELKGQAGMEFNNCYELRGINGDGCAVYNEITLQGKIKDNGYFVVAKNDLVPNFDMTTTKADFQNGPDAIQVVYKHRTKGEIILDTFAYKSEQPFCDLSSGTPVAASGYDTAYQRCPDTPDSTYTGDNSTDFVLTASFTPGEANPCDNNQKPDVVENDKPHVSSSGCSFDINQNLGFGLNIAMLLLLLFMFELLLFKIKRRNKRKSD